MQNSGNQPPATNPFKGRYMLKDIKLNSSLFGTKDLTVPKEFPANSMRAQRILTAIKLTHPKSLHQASLDFWDAYWISGKSLNEETYREILAKHFKNPDELLEFANNDKTKAELTNTTKLAMDSGAFGLPWFVCEKGSEKRVFFGSDRMESIAHWLELPYHGINPKPKL